LSAFLVGAFAVTSSCLALAPAAEAAPAFTKCRAWRMQGQTWYGYQSNGYAVRFTLRTSSRDRLYGHAAASKGDPNQNHDIVGSQYISGSVRSDGGVGTLFLNIVWTNHTSGQYFGTAVNVRRTASGSLLAGLQGTAVETSGRGGAATWYADGTSPTFGDSSRVFPLYCPAADVIGKRLRLG
jgi:hypothetical protein